MADQPTIPTPPPITGGQRQQAISLIQGALNRPPVYGNFTPNWSEGNDTAIYTARNPYPNAGPLKDDPQMELAVQTMKTQYPNLFKGIDRIHIGADENISNPDVAGFTVNSAGRGEKAIYLRHSGGNFDAAMDVLRHELAHVTGATDNLTTNIDPNSAYEVGYQSSRLHRDIQLPKEKK